MTARHLIDIWSALDFQKHLEDVSEVDFQRRGRNNRLKKVATYKVELCIVLTNERTKTAPVSTIICSIDGNATFLSDSSSGIAGLKRKSPPSPFTFHASSMCISLFALIETM